MQCAAQDEFLNDHGQPDGYDTSGSRERRDSSTSWRHAISGREGNTMNTHDEPNREGPTLRVPIGGRFDHACVNQRARRLPVSAWRSGSVLKKGGDTTVSVSISLSSARVSCDVAVIGMDSGTASTVAIRARAFLRPATLVPKVRLPNASGRSCASIASVAKQSLAEERSQPEHGSRDGNEGQHWRDASATR
jgi:hypothetical protein